MTVIQDRFRRMVEETWRNAIAAVAYELARRNGESPMDRGAALGMRLEELCERSDLASAFERFKAERRYRLEESGVECAARVEALVYRGSVRTLVAA
jgi:hypothetical protein